MLISAMVLTVVSNVLYHIFQKMTPSNVNPLLSLCLCLPVSLSTHPIPYCKSPLPVV